MRALLFAFLVVAIVVAGCGDDDDDAATPTTVVVDVIATTTTLATTTTATAPNTTTTTATETTTTTQMAEGIPVVFCTEAEFEETVTGPFIAATFGEWSMEDQGERVWAETVGDCQGLILGEGPEVTFGRNSPDEAWQTVSYEAPWLSP